MIRLLGFAVGLGLAGSVLAGEPASEVNAECDTCQARHRGLQALQAARKATSEAECQQEARTEQDCATATQGTVGVPSAESPAPQPLD